MINLLGVFFVQFIKCLQLQMRMRPFCELIRSAIYAEKSESVPVSRQGKETSDQFRFRKLPICPSPKLTLTLTSHFGQNDGIGEG